MISGAASEASQPHGPRGLQRRARLIALATGAAALAGVLLTLLVGSPDDADPGRARVAGGVPVSVAINSHRPRRPVHGRFLGLSFEVAALPQIARYGESGNFVKLLRSIGPGVLRFGGVSADTQVAWTDRSTPRPAWAGRVLVPGDLRRLGRLARRSGWRVLLTVGLAHFEPAAAAREVAAAKSALGRHLAAIEVGNEPDAYAHHAFRALPWTYAQYNREVRSYRRAIAKAARGIRLAGPGVSGSRIFATWGPREAAAQRPSLLTGHHYPLGCHQPSAPSIDRLLSAEIHSLEDQSLYRFMSVSRSSSIPVRLDEVGSVSCGGKAGISDTFASALWATGYIAQAMATGVAGINFEGNPANCRGYSPVCAASPARLAAGVLSVRPQWYALLLATELIGARPVRSTVTSAGTPNLLVRTFMAGDGRLRVVIVDDDPPGSLPAEMRLRVGGGYGAARVLALAGPSPSATTGVTLGGRVVAQDGSWSHPATLPRTSARHGTISLTVAPSSAALLTVLPRGAQP